MIIMCRHCFFLYVWNELRDETPNLQNLTESNSNYDHIFAFHTQQNRGRQMWEQNFEEAMFDYILKHGIDYKS